MAAEQDSTENNRKVIDEFRRTGRGKGSVVGAPSAADHQGGQKWAGAREPI